MKLSQIVQHQVFSETRCIYYLVKQDKEKIKAKVVPYLYPSVEVLIISICLSAQNQSILMEKIAKQKVGSVEA